MGHQENLGVGDASLAKELVLVDGELLFKVEGVIVVVHGGKATEHGGGLLYVTL